jgi:hypothetical protein
MVKAARLFSGLAIFFAIIGTVNVVLATPLLQLDIADGFYDSASQTTVAKTDQFTLYAYLTTTKKDLLNKTYYISAAVTPQYGPLEGYLGSFTFDNLSDQNKQVTVNATQDMAYGVPPQETLIGKDANDLSTHGIYETYFKEFSFTFSKSLTSFPIDAQEKPDAVPGEGSGMYYVPFLVNTSGLASGYAIHFDLYSVKLGTGKDVIKDIDIDSFAPFSHDAEGPAAVPEPGTIVLIGSSLVIVAVWKKYGKI